MKYTANMPGAPRGVVVVVNAQDERAYTQSHERVTRAGIAKKLAMLKGFEFAGEHDPFTRYSDPVYFVPSDTLVGVGVENELGVCSEHDLFGGVVPQPFVATKAITHPLVHTNAYAPVGWSHEFGRRVQHSVLFGFSVFTIEDARRAGLRLLEHGPIASEARASHRRARAGRCRRRRWAGVCARCSGT